MDIHTFVKERDCMYTWSWDSSNTKQKLSNTRFSSQSDTTPFLSWSNAINAYYSIQNTHVHPNHNMNITDSQPVAEYCNHGQFCLAILSQHQRPSEGMGVAQQQQQLAYVASKDTCMIVCVCQSPSHINCVCCTLTPVLNVVSYLHVVYEWKYQEIHHNVNWNQWSQCCRE